MKKLLLSASLVILAGCGEPPPAPMTPEKEKEMQTQMNQEMSSMMDGMKGAAPPGTPKPKPAKK